MKPFRKQVWITHKILITDIRSEVRVGGEVRFMNCSMLELLRWFKVMVNIYLLNAMGEPSSELII